MGLVFKPADASVILLSESDILSYYADRYEINSANYELVGVELNSNGLSVEYVLTDTLCSECDEADADTCNCVMWQLVRGQVYRTL